MGDINAMHGYGQGGWMVLWWIGGIALLILLVWFLAKKRRWEARTPVGLKVPIPKQGEQHGNE